MTQNSSLNHVTLSTRLRKSIAVKFVQIERELAEIEGVLFNEEMYVRGKLLHKSWSDQWKRVALCMLFYVGLVGLPTFVDLFRSV